MIDKKYGLALHTSTRELGLAISNFAGDARSQVWFLDRELSSLIHQYLVEFIQPQSWADIGFMAVVKGPGGFTGTRIGVVTARTLGQQLNIPVFAVSALAAVALAAGKRENNIIAVQMPAQRGKLFGGIYQVNSDNSGVKVLLADAVMTPELWQGQLDNLGCDYQLINADGALGTTVTSVLELAYWDWQTGQRPSWDEALPFYGQHPVEV